MWKFVVLLFIGVALREAQAARKVDAAQIVRRSLDKRSLGEEKRELKDVLELTEGESLETDRSLTTVKGSKKTRYHETYKGIPVYGSVVTADDQDQSDVSGQLVQDIGEDVKSVIPVLSSEQALEKALLNEGDEMSEIENHHVNLIIHIDDGETARLAYIVSYVDITEKKVKRPFHIIDANDGNILDHWQGMDSASHTMAGSGGNQKTGEYKYGTDYDLMKVTTNDGGVTCLLENNDVKVINLNHATSGSATYSVPCSTGATDAINGAYGPAHDALYFGNVIFDMYKQWYNTAPLTFKLTMRVHYSSNYENAFWNGVSMTFGDGLNRFHPLVSLDVSAHEVSHGFTEQNSGLQYSAQSGGMNEAFSDMSGEAVKNFMKGTNDWQVGADIFKSNGALRYMDNPPKDGKSIGHANDYYSGMDVHYSSGVFNKAFYLLATKTNWSTKKAFEIMIVANQLYWSSTSTFDQGACGVLKAASDKGYNVNDVTDAFSQVGVSTCSNPPTPDNNNELSSDVAVPLSGSTGSEVSYTLQNGGNGTVTIKTSGGTGDLDLYVKFGSAASRSSYDARPYLSGNAETITFDPSKVGTYHIMVHGYTAYNGASLVATFTSAGACGGKKLCNNQEVTGLGTSTGKTLEDYTIEIPSGASNLKIVTSAGNGDADLYVKFGSSPTTSSYDYRPYISGSNEEVSIPSPKTGTYHIMIRAYNSFSDLTLKASYSTTTKRHVKKVDLRSLVKHVKKVQL